MGVSERPARCEACLARRRAPSVCRTDRRLVLPLVVGHRRVARSLWVDVVTQVELRVAPRDDVPRHVRHAIRIRAQFQREDRVAGGLVQIPVGASMHLEVDLVQVAMACKSSSAGAQRVCVRQSQREAKPELFAVLERVEAGLRLSTCQLAAVASARFRAGVLRRAVLHVEGNAASGASGRTRRDRARRVSWRCPCCASAPRACGAVAHAVRAVGAVAAACIHRSECIVEDELGRHAALVQEQDKRQRSRHHPRRWASAPRRR